MDIFTMVSTLLSVLIGGVITWYSSRHYYKKATADLVKEAAALRHLSTIMLNAMEDAGLVKLNRNKEGEISGRMVEMGALFESHSRMMGELDVKHAPKA